MPASVLRAAMTVEQLWQPVPGGSGTYIRELVRALRDYDTAEVVGVAARGHGGHPMDGLGIHVHPSRLPRAALYEAWNSRRAPRIPRSCGEVDVIHATTWAIPPRSHPLVVTVHDLAFLRAPEHFTARGNRYFRRALEVARTDADLVLVPSQTTADDCHQNGFSPDRVRVVPHGVRARAVAASEVADLHARFDLHAPYLLWCGTLEPRKNLPTLLDAFADVAEHDLDLSLVLVGPKGWGRTSAEVSARLGGPLADRVIVLGRLSHDDLQVAYTGARAFCFPSLWEGFGMPVLEAMAHGTPVVTSSGTAMAEFTQGAGLLVDPRDSDALAGAILDVTGPRHDELAASASVRARDFTWARAAEQTVDAYHSLAPSSSQPA
jgi:glycosyltransferase involved in cell wall biosynthesis